MAEPQEGDLSELIGIQVASAILEVPVEQVRTMADQGMLTPSGPSDAPQFVRAEVIAARELGG
jgi:hypothetical protein